MQSSNNGKPNFNEDEEKRPQYAAHDTDPSHELDVGEIRETTKRGLKARHAQMIALGGTIGTGKFFQEDFGN